METRANYILIGACALLGIVLGLGFFVWLAKFQMDRQYAYYDVLFDDVSGLSRAADVRFSGLSVGQVISLDLDHTGGGLVRVRIEVDADTPLHEGSSAQLQAQGVTGVSLVALAGGDPTKPLLRHTAGGGVPIIPGHRSVVQSIAKDAPALIADARGLLAEMQTLFGPANQGKVASILTNTDAATGDLKTAIAGVSSIANSVQSATGQIAGFTDKLVPLAENADGALTEARGTMASMTGAFDKAQGTLGTADDTLTAFGGVAKTADGLLTQDGAAALADLRATTAQVKALTDSLGSEAHAVLTATGETATTATARLDQLEGTITALDTALAKATTTLASINSAAGGIDGLVRGDGTALVGDARTTLASVQASADAIQHAATDDLPAIMTEIRQALAAVNATVAQASGDITSFTGDLAPLAAQATTTLGAATAAFQNANAALDHLEPILASADGTLQSARAAFGTADRILSTDISPATESLRTSVVNMSSAIDAISGDLPAVSQELKTTLAQATATIQRINSIVQQNAGPLNQFTAQGLPQFTRFVQEAQALVGRLDRIAQQFERDPARFLLSPPAPTYRR
ncbi:MAG: MlaD family protein [Amaricoccus sp.]|uniref:MlaD family protein n=1 Tax=Amaricoccus sp. TaxID=1872485 RepID=UPI0039E5B3E8